MILITGESGVGKDVVARHVHALSRRADHPMIALNCAGVTESLLEAELFGHVKGSFTGAFRDKIGKLQAAHRGTIFLDEVGEMSPRMQALLLTFLESGEIQPVGSDGAPRLVDVRVIAATNRDLRSLVAEGRFREDLVYRLNVVHIEVPPLRERRSDIPALIAFLCRRAGKALTFSVDAQRALQVSHWPGNVRELQNTIERLIWTVSGGECQVADLPRPIRLNAGAAPSVTPARERRRQIADHLYDGLVTAQYSFWSQVYPLFLQRDITRHDLRTLVGRGLDTTCGNYRALLTLFGMPQNDYKRFQNFLAAHGYRVDFRTFRVTATHRVTRTASTNVSPLDVDAQLACRSHGERNGSLDEAAGYAEVDQAHRHLTPYDGKIPGGEIERVDHWIVRPGLTAPSGPVHNESAGSARCKSTSYNASPSITTGRL